ncbi:hypothetical protein J2S09_004441 [Bacillus fengqiuensis]|nr:hypothetical protein [Bacillus fengqiuensis]
MPIYAESNMAYLGFIYTEESYWQITKKLNQFSFQRKKRWRVFGMMIDGFQEALLRERGRSKLREACDFERSSAFYFLRE